METRTKGALQVVIAHDHHRSAGWAAPSRMTFRRKLPSRIRGNVIGRELGHAASIMRYEQRDIALVAAQTAAEVGLYAVVAGNFARTSRTKAYARSGWKFHFGTEHRFNAIRKLWRDAWRGGLPLG